MGVCRSVLYGLGAISLSLAIGCSAQGPVASLQIELPEATKTPPAMAFSLGEGWGLQEPEGTDQINCYALLMSHPEDLKGLHCTDAEENLVVDAGGYWGPFRAGSTIEISVMPGKERALHLVGLTALSEELCDQFKIDGSLKGGYSGPQIVAEEKVDLVPGDNLVTLTMKVPGKAFEKCTPIKEDTAPAVPELPRAILSGLPLNPSNQTQLEIEVSGQEGASSYRYQLGPSPLDCTLLEAYSEPRDVSEKIIHDLSGLVDGTYQLCALGGSGESWQPLADATSYTWVKDTVAPELDAVSLNSGAPYTTSSAVSLMADGSGADHMLISTSEQCLPGAGESYEPFTSEKTVLLPSPAEDGAKSLYVQLKDLAGNTSDCLQAEITLDTTPPGPPHIDVLQLVFGLSKGPHVQFTDAVDELSGILYHEIKVLNEDLSELSGWQEFFYGEQVEGLALSEGDTYYYELRAMDKAGNVGPALLSDPWIATEGDLVPSFVQVAAGHSFSCGLTSEGKAYCWGQNSSGALGNGTTAHETSPVPVGTTETLTDLAAGSAHICGLSSKGEVFCWGENSRGQLGIGTTNHESAPALVNHSALGRARKISAGESHSCALMEDGRVFCWGRGDFGQLGNGGTSDLSSPTEVVLNLVTGAGVLDLTSSGDHSCILSNMGQLQCWGSNSFGQLGTETQGGSSITPADVVAPSGVRFVSVSAGLSHTCALSSEGAAYCWGSNLAGQLGTSATPTTKPQLVDTSQVSAFGKFKSITAGAANTCALNSKGEAYCWGKNIKGQLGVNTNTDTTRPEGAAIAFPEAHSFVRNIAVGTDHVCAVHASGKPFCWGGNTNGALGVGTTLDAKMPMGLNTNEISRPGPAFTQTAAGDGFACGLTPEGRVYCWGSNGSGALGNPSFLQKLRPASIDRVSVIGDEPFAHITAGSSHACALSIRGNAYCWGGATGYLQPKTVFTGDVAGDKSFKKISAGKNHTCALGTHGKVYCWGDNTSGALGSGTTDSHQDPFPIDDSSISSSTFIDVAVGDQHSCAMSAEGEVFCWGAAGLIGDGTSEERLTPTPLALNPPKTFVSLAAGADHSCAITTEGQAYCWGKNAKGQLGDGSSSNALEPIQVDEVPITGTFKQLALGEQTSCAITTTGESFCWGNNADGALGTGTTDPATSPKAMDLSEASELVHISLGAGFGCAVTAEGQPFCWGRNSEGQLGKGDLADSPKPLPVDTSHLP